MTLPTLYSRTSTSAIQNWTIEVQDDAYCTHFGDVIEGEGNRSGGAGAMTFENEQGIRFNSNIQKRARAFFKHE